VGGYALVMKKAKIDLREYDWTVYIFFYSRPSDSDEILAYLRSFGCKGDNLYNAKRSLKNGRKNEGLTYSNYLERESVIVIGDASSLDELMNSSAHEIDHLAKHIVEANGVDVFSEQASYLVGDLTQKIYKVIENEY
jgi:hypothetical protein